MVIFFALNASEAVSIASLRVNVRNVDDELTLAKLHHQIGSCYAYYTVSTLNVNLWMTDVVR